MHHIGVHSDREYVLAMKRGLAQGRLEMAPEVNVQLENDCGGGNRSASTCPIPGESHVMKEASGGEVRNNQSTELPNNGNEQSLDSHVGMVLLPEGRRGILTLKMLSHSHQLETILQQHDQETRYATNCPLPELVDSTCGGFPGTACFVGQTSGACKVHDQERLSLSSLAASPGTTSQSQSYPPTFRSSAHSFGDDCKSESHLYCQPLEDAESGEEWTLLRSRVLGSSCGTPTPRSVSGDFGHLMDDFMLDDEDACGNDEVCWRSSYQQYA